MELTYSNRHPIVKRQVLQIKLPAIKAIWKSSLSQTAKITFSVIHAHTNKDNSKSWPSVSTLAACACASRKRIRDGLAELESAGYLKITTASSGKYIFNVTPCVVVEQIEETVVFDDDNTSNSGNSAAAGSNVPSKDDKKAVVKDKKEGKADEPPVSSLSDVFAATSIRAKPIMLKELTANAVAYKKQYKSDGAWNTDENRCNYLKLRDFIRSAEISTYGCRISTI